MNKAFLTCGLFSLNVLALCPPPQAALKKYQVEHKSKGESLEKCQAELKKLRRKSQGSKNPSKYGEKEMQVRRSAPLRASSVSDYCGLAGRRAQAKSACFSRIYVG